MLAYLRKVKFKIQTWNNLNDRDAFCGMKIAYLQIKSKPISHEESRPNRYHSVIFNCQ